MVDQRTCACFSLKFPQAGCGFAWHFLFVLDWAPESGVGSSLFHMFLYSWIQVEETAEKLDHLQWMTETYKTSKRTDSIVVTQMLFPK